MAVQEQLFEQSQRLALAGQQAAIDRYRSQLATDQELIELRERIRATAAVQLANGIIGFADYFADASQLNQARLNLQLHRLQLLQAQAALLTAQEPPLRPLNLNLYATQAMRPALFTLLLPLLPALLSGCQPPAPDFDASGNFETTEYVVAAQAAGPLLRLAVREGDEPAGGPGSGPGGYAALVSAPRAAARKRSGRARPDPDVPAHSWPWSSKRPTCGASGSGC
ncbi:hypothetical protein ACFQT0_30630 [Hymenobacter humi]|uniref:TolC family protein n=1 Tax=Hymenobacter humi TaxID=1411620 RepID=A0ABW2UE16_9BACT